MGSQTFLFQDALILLSIEDPKEICVCNILIRLESELRNFKTILSFKKIMKPILGYHLTNDFIIGIESFGKFHCVLVDRMREKWQITS